jgi:hypothetical protein
MYHHRRKKSKGSEDGEVEINEQRYVVIEHTCMVKLSYIWLVITVESCPYTMYSC